jgi:hypothetical protein
MSLEEEMRSRAKARENEATLLEINLNPSGTARVRHFDFDGLDPAASLRERPGRIVRLRVTRKSVRRSAPPSPPRADIFKCL